MSTHTSPSRTQLKNLMAYIEDEHKTAEKVKEIFSGPMTITFVPYDFHNEKLDGVEIALEVNNITVKNGAKILHMEFTARKVSEDGSVTNYGPTRTLGKLVKMITSVTLSSPCNHFMLAHRFTGGKTILFSALIPWQLRQPTLL